jgi:hypothetical protein
MSLNAEVFIGETMMSTCYLALDGDDIGRRLELFMLTNDPEALHDFALSFSGAVEALLDKLSSIGAEVLLHGGDSLLMRIGDSPGLDAVLVMVRTVVQERPFTFSGGYGPTMRAAYLALKLAKSTGKNRIEGPLSDQIER